MRPGDTHLPLHVSFLADQLGGGTGGSRFTHGFLHHLFASSSAQQQIDRLSIVITQRQSTAYLGSYPKWVRVLQRTFPTRLRQSAAAPIFGHTLPRADIAHGPFYYVFPGQGRRSLVTVHDLSMFNEKFHPDDHRKKQVATLTASVHRADLVVTDSNAVLAECRTRWPDLSSKFIRIYLGSGPVPDDAQEMIANPIELVRPYILTVGTVEPRKNYGSLLIAYETLVHELGELAPDLVVAGRRGWMSETVIDRLLALENTGRVHWLREASDHELSLLYKGAALFTYLSIYEGFGYPPFEATFARVPLVISNLSSLGEIWQEHARCVDPSNIRDIVAGWKWALGLDFEERNKVIAQQLARAQEFSWARCVDSYVDTYLNLLHMELRRRL